MNFIEDKFELSTISYLTIYYEGNNLNMKVFALLLSIIYNSSIRNLEESKFNI